MHARTVCTLLSLTALTASAFAADKPAATFYRAVNLNGPAVTIDGHAWEGKDAKNVTAEGHTLDYQNVALKPPTDAARARMIRSSVWGNSVKVTLTAVPKGTYQVVLYTWEDNNAVNFSVSLNGKVVLPRHESRSAGSWDRHGPWPVEVGDDGKIVLAGNGGDANFSGVEVWAGGGPIPAPKAAGEDKLVNEPTAQQLEFFEKKVRPVLVKHCYACHSEEAGKLRGELRLDTRAAVLKGGAGGAAVVPGDPDASPLVAAVRYGGDVKMPPKAKLSAGEIADLEAWVRMGLPDPRTGAAAAAAIDWAKARQHWAYQPVRDPALPAVRDAAWAKTPIDRFVLAKLEAAGLKPAPPAEPRVLLRRLTFDLTGLPPTPEEVEAFENDPSPAAYEKAVDRLLASPHYGERWGRHWLDLARYADTAGCNSDFPVPTAYLYRNWVIDALNADMPYDRFVREQVAGDLLPRRTGEERYDGIVATGYLAIGRRYGSLADEFHLTLEDNIDNLGKAVLGLSVSCARCHDHKFDPIPQADYYALYGILDSARYAFPGTEIPPQPKDFVPLAPPAQAAAARDFERRLAELGKEIDKLAKQKDAAAALEEAKRRRDEMLKERPAVRLAYAVQEGKPADARLQRKGDPRQLGDPVPRGFLQILGGQKLPPTEKGSGRLQLAEWLTSRDNPLTARVMANRIWQYHFGQGLVRTPNDFGARGTPPTHPELLDYLASRFVESGWSLKAMHKQTVLSRAYQMACVEEASYREKDPKNTLWWTFNRRRLSAEEFRDGLLAVSGRLDATRGGAHPFPPEPFKFTQHKPYYGVYDTDRRSVYLMQQRIKKHPLLEAFDGADPNAITAERPLNTTPIQALFAMNDAFVHGQAAAFADRVIKASPEGAERVTAAYRLAYGRAPTAAERELMLGYVRDCTQALAGAKSGGDPERQAWASLMRVIVCANEFSFVD